MCICEYEVYVYMCQQEYRHQRSLYTLGPNACCEYMHMHVTILISKQQYMQSCMNKYSKMLKKITNAWAGFAF